jgi:hypothetical protein
LNIFDSQRAQTSDEQSLIKARYCRSILKVVSTDLEARGLLEGLATEQPTSDTSAPMAQAEEAALTSIKELARYQHGRNAPHNSTEWVRAARAVEFWLSVHDQ